MEFIPFADIKKHEPVVVVDSFHPRGFMLSHWKGSPKPAGVPAGDTSTDWVLNTLQLRPELLKNYRWVTNNHFDIDGFLGIWALMNPDLALSQAGLLRRMARISDFRELRLTSEEDHTALQLVCWINRLEQEFYAPFASYNPQNPEFRGQGEAAWCVPKYHYFLPRFAQMLSQPGEGRACWEAEYNRVLEHWQLVQGRGRHQLYPEVKLLEVNSPEPLHYYALFGQSAAADAVLAIYPDNRYELEYKYTGWVDTRRAGYPRLDLRRLAHQLNAWEQSSYRWRAEPMTDTAPLLRLGGEELSKEERYHHPFTRRIHSSSIDEDSFRRLVLAFFRQNLKGISPKPNWSWAETRQLFTH